MDDCEVPSLVGDGSFMCGGVKPPLTVGAPQIREGASLLEPTAHTRVDVAVHVPGKGDGSVYAFLRHTQTHTHSYTHAFVFAENSTLSHTC